jgi:hypothetical protein
MPLNGCPVTGDGETCGPECAQDAGTPLPSRPERARANNAKAWKPPPVVAANSDAGATSMLGHAPTGSLQRDYVN